MFPKSLTFNARNYGWQHICRKYVQHSWKYNLELSKYVKLSSLDTFPFLWPPCIFWKYSDEVSKIKYFPNFFTSYLCFCSLIMLNGVWIVSPPFLYFSSAFQTQLRRPLWGNARPDNFVKIKTSHADTRTSSSWEKIKVATWFPFKLCSLQRMRRRRNQTMSLLEVFVVLDPTTYDMFNETTVCRRLHPKFQQLHMRLRI